MNNTEAQSKAIHAQQEKYLTVYHGTTPEIHERIQNTGILKGSKEHPGFLTDRPDIAKYFGSKTIKVRVHKNDVIHIENHPIGRLHVSEGKIYAHEKDIKI